MKRILHIFAIIISILITFIAVFICIQLEIFYYSDYGCGCSSGGHGFYLTQTSKFIGYTILILSYIILTISIWNKFNLSRLWAIPAILSFLITIYGNGFMLFSTGACGFSIHKRTAYIFDTHLADTFRSDLYNINDKKPTNDGKILGFYLNKSILYLFRINADPIKLKTSFLFWHLDENNIKDYFNSFDGVSINHLDTKTIEIIGGKNMPIEAFLNKKKQIPNIHEKILLNEKNGTTRLLLRIK
jgi:hypothetical protein